MLKYLMSFLVVLQLCSFADEVKEEGSQEPEQYAQCEISFDQCVAKCDENSDKYSECYDNCEQAYQQCVNGGAEAK